MRASDLRSRPAKDWMTDRRSLPGLKDITVFLWRSGGGSLLLSFLAIVTIMVHPSESTGNISNLPKYRCARLMGQQLNYMDLLKIHC